MTCFQRIAQSLQVGSIPMGSNILVIGPPGIGKSVLSRYVAAECVNTRTGIVYVTLDSTPKSVEESIIAHLDSGEAPDEIAFIDCFSWLIGDIRSPNALSHLSNLGDLSVKLLTTLQEKGPGSTVIFDSISTLFVYNAENEITRFLQVNVARIKHMGSYGLWVVEEGIHSPSFYNTLRHIMDVTLELRFEETAILERRLRVHTCKGSTHSTRWIPFDIRDKGRIVINSYDLTIDHSNN